MFERFTRRAKRALDFAQQQAVALHHDFIGTEHMLLGLAVEGDGLGAQILRDVGLDERRLRAAVVARTKVEPPRLLPDDADALADLGIDLGEVRKRVEASFGEGALPAAPTVKIPFTAVSKKVLEQSLRTALALGHNYIGTEHLLLGLASVEDGLGSEILAEVTTLDDLQERVVIKLRELGCQA